MSNYLDKETISNAFCFLIEHKSKYSVQQKPSKFHEIMKDEYDKIMKDEYDENKKFNEAEMLYVGEVIKTSCLMDQDYNSRSNSWKKIKNKAEIKLPNSLMLANTTAIFSMASDKCKVPNPPPECSKVTGSINTFSGFSKTLSILRDNNASAFMVDRKDSFNRKDNFWEASARLVRVDDSDLEAEIEITEIMWNSYKEYVIKFWEEL